MSHAGIVLCGGRSSRMGRAKAWLPWFGQTMIEHVVSRVLKVVNEVAVVTSVELELPSGLTRQGVRVVRDQDSERGPLAGIRDGLESLSSDVDRVFVTSTDAPFLNEDDVSGMLRVGKVCAPIDEGHVQVLSAVYPRSAADLATRLLGQGARRPLDLLKALEFEPLDSIPRRDGKHAWQGFNTPNAYLEAVRSVDPSAEAEVLWQGAWKGPGKEPEFARFPVGSLGEVIEAYASRQENLLGLVADGQVADRFRVEVGPFEIAKDLNIPVGPGESVRIGLAESRDDDRAVSKGYES